MEQNKLVGITMLLLCMHAPKVVAQKNVDTQHLFWARYYLKLKIDENYQIRQELEERTYWYPWRQHQFVIRTVAERKLGKGWNAGVGLAYFVQSLPQDPEITNYYNQLELRPMLELAFGQPMADNISLNHRYWSEFRYFELPNGSFEYGTTRMRYKLELNYTPTNKITLKAFDEIFLNLGGKIVHNVFDQNRYGASIQYMTIANLGLELGYFNWFQERISGEDFYNRHIVRLTIHQSINFKKPKSK